MDAKNYVGREQTFVKHYTLVHYLERLAFKLGMSRDNLTINYVDGFSGPWKSASEKYEDTSPDLAVRYLLKVQESLREVHRKTLKLDSSLSKRTSRHSKIYPNGAIGTPRSIYKSGMESLKITSRRLRNSVDSGILLLHSFLLTQPVGRDSH